MVNCTAAEDQNLMNFVYGDYMDDIGSIIFNESPDLAIARLIK
jgi:hypothetical protein